MEQRSQLSRKYIGTVLAWGSGPKGQLGMGTEEVNPATNIYSTHNNDVTHMEHPAPIPILMNKNVVSLSAGSSHVLALTQTGTVYSWGSGEDGRLGLNDYENRYEPTLIEKLSLKGRKVCVVGAGSAHSLACTEGGRR